MAVLYRLNEKLLRVYWHSPKMTIQLYISDGIIENRRNRKIVGMNGEKVTCLAVTVLMLRGESKKRKSWEKALIP